MVETLVKDIKYAGQYVALKSFEDNTVVGHDKDPIVAHKKAVKNGYADSVILYVPEKDAVFIYTLKVY